MAAILTPIIQPTSTHGEPQAFITVTLYGATYTLLAPTPESTSSFRGSRRTIFEHFANTTFTSVASTTGVLQGTTTSVANSTGGAETGSSSDSDVWMAWLGVGFALIALMGVFFGRRFENAEKKHKLREAQTADIELQTIAPKDVPVVPADPPKVLSAPFKGQSTGVVDTKTKIKRGTWASDAETLRGSVDGAGGKMGSQFDERLVGCWSRSDGASSIRNLVANPGLGDEVTVRAADVDRLESGESQDEVDLQLGRVSSLWSMLP